MKTAFLLFAPAFLLGAGCASGVQTPEASEILQQETIVVEEPLAMTTYVMGGKVNILFDAPDGWWVRQLDGGGFSIVLIAHSKDQKDRFSLAVLQPWPDDNGHQETYQEWLERVGYIQATGSREIDAVQFDIWRIPQAEGNVYTAVLDPQTPRYLEILVPEAFASVEAAILDSILLFPTQSQQEAANRMPEWSAQDSR